MRIILAESSRIISREKSWNVKVNLKIFNYKMLFFMFHDGMKAASIAEKYISCVSGLC